MKIKCINSSKVYCKLILYYSTIRYNLVLIVAKCIVNGVFMLKRTIDKLGINSSKVYCKLKIGDEVLVLVLGINSSKVYCKF